MVYFLFFSLCIYLIYYGHFCTNLVNRNEIALFMVICALIGWPFIPWGWVVFAIFFCLVSGHSLGQGSQPYMHSVLDSFSFELLVNLKPCHQPHILFLQGLHFLSVSLPIIGKILLIFT